MAVLGNQAVARSNPIRHWLKNSASGSIPPADLPARLVSQNGEAGVISKLTYFGMYTPAPRLARLQWATTVLWYTSLVR